jgi:hypothetical protein
MSALLKPELSERRVNVDPATGARLKRLLIAGGGAEAMAGAFARLLPNAGIETALRPDQAVLAMSAGFFDATLVDCRTDSYFSSVAILAARQHKQGSVVLLAPQNFALDEKALLSNLTLFDNSGSGAELLAALGFAAPERVKAERPSPASEAKMAQEPAAAAASRTIARSGSWLANLLPRLTPLYSLIYKNLALTILGALFAAFVAFGIMIVFFLTSDKWSAPITLSQGHELVAKVSRELSDLNVRRNQISEQIDDARKNLASSQGELDRARQLASMIEGTISAEIETRSALKAEIENHNEALRRVAEQYGAGSVNPSFKGNLARDFNRRLINRNTFDAGKLAQLETAHRTAQIRNEISANDVEIRRLASTLAALSTLSGHVESALTPDAAKGGADLVPLLNQVIDVRKSVADAASENKNAVKRDGLLTNSLRVVETSIAQISSTPLARAAAEPVTVLFVPYENADQYAQGAPLYACAIGIFFCSDIGTVGKSIPGETVATHPFFNKPVRGSFVEAKLTDQEAAKKEIVHVNRRPLFF